MFFHCFTILSCCKTAIEDAGIDSYPFSTTRLWPRNRRNHIPHRAVVEKRCLLHDNLNIFEKSLTIFSLLLSPQFTVGRKGSLSCGLSRKHSLRFKNWVCLKKTTCYAIQKSSSRDPFISSENVQTMKFVTYSSRNAFYIG